MSLNDLHYRIHNSSGLVAMVADPEVAALLLASLGAPSSVRMGAHPLSTVFTVTEENEAQVHDSIDWTADQIRDGEEASYQARRGAAFLSRI